MLWVCLVLAGSQLCRAQTEVLYTGGSGERNVVQSDGTTAVPDGNYVEVGYFDSNSGFSPGANSTDLISLGAHWHEYGFTNIETFAPFGSPVPGRFRGDSLLNDSTFDSKKIYLWIFQTSDNGAPAGDFSNVSQYGIFSSTLSNWSFPVDGATPPANQTALSSNDVDTYVFGSSVAGSPGSLELANVASVPEPGSLSLLAMGLVFGRFALRRKG